MAKRPIAQPSAPKRAAGAGDEAVLAEVTCRFGERAEAVARTFERSPSFRGLCRDYLTCLAALGRWRGSGSPEAQVRSAEYEELLAELTRDIEVLLVEGE